LGANVSKRSKRGSKRGRYPLDEQYTYYGFAYVENNPVKAKMVKNATDYKYSSAMCHAGLVNNSLVTDYDINTKQDSKRVVKGDATLF
jgi:hypothetical protein